MKIKYIIIIVIFYLVFFRKKDTTTAVDTSGTLRSKEFDILERDYKERIEMLEKKIQVSQGGPLA